MSELQISSDLSLPLDAVTEAFLIIARRGMGKTTAGAVVAEEMIGAGLPVVILDPTGASWGLRSSADGSEPGLPVVIFGGEHADVPLDEHAGALLARLIVEQRFPAVIDLSLLSKSAMRRFVADFAETLYHRNREPLHLIVDECDLFIPQKTFAGMERLVGAIDDIVRRGRIRGLGVTLISQRPAAVNTDVRSQAGCLIVLGLTGSHDINAIDDWVRLHADPEEAKTVKASLPSLPVGTAWFWSPGWLGILRQVKIRRRRTFDSSATPKAGAQRILPTEWATVDLDALTKVLAAAEPVLSGKGSGEASLRRRIAELERELATERAKQAPEPQVVEVPAVSDELIAKAVGIVGDLIEALDRVGSHPTIPVPAATSRAVPPTPRPAAAASTRDATPRSRPPAPGDTGLGRCERAILTVLAQHGRRTTTQVALLSGYSHKSGGFRNSLSLLRTAGRIEGRGEVAATAAGLAALGDYESLPSGPALVEWWYNQLGKAERSILAVLVDVWPDECAVADIAEATGYSASSGGFRNALSRLRSLELASGRGALRAADVLGEAWRGGAR